MKRMILKNWMMAALLAGACCGFVACDDDDDNGGQTPPPTPGIEAVVGEYAGTMQIVEKQPKEGEGEGETPIATQLEAAVTKDAIEFSEFPIRSLIAKVMNVPEDDPTVDGIIEAVGPVSYTLPYTAVMGEDKASVQMTLKPEVLKIYLGDPEADGLAIVVTISAVGENSYTLESKALRFHLTVDQIQLGEGEDAGDPIPSGLNPDFKLTKK